MDFFFWLKNKILKGHLSTKFLEPLNYIHNEFKLPVLAMKDVASEKVKSWGQKLGPTINKK